MKRLILLALYFLPLTVAAQNVWERPEDVTEAQNTTENKKAEAEKPNPDAKYLVGAVPEVDGKVEWQLDVDVPNKSAEQIYDIILRAMTDLTKTENQLEGSCVALVNRHDHIIVASVKEWLVFKDNFISLDRAKLSYNLVAYCSDNHLTVKMNRMNYRYEEDRRNKNDSHLTAEEWITDKVALNRKKTKLLPGSAKFRRKTVDRKDYVFDTLKQIVLK